MGVGFWFVAVEMFILGTYSYLVDWFEFKKLSIPMNEWETDAKASWKGIFCIWVTLYSLK